MRVKRVAKNRNESENEKEKNVKGEEDVGDDVKPMCGFGQLVEEDRYYAGGHVDNKPSGTGRVLSVTLQNVWVGTTIRGRKVSDDSGKGAVERFLLGCCRSFFAVGISCDLASASC